MINLNLNNDNNVIDDYIIIYNKIGQRPNRIIIDDLFVGVDFEKIVDEFKKDSDLNNCLTELIPYEDQPTIKQKIFLEVEKNVWLSYIALNKQNEDFICNNVHIYYTDDSIEFVNKLKESLMSSVFSFEEENGNMISGRLCTVSITSNGLDIEPIIIEPTYNIEKYYHPETLKSINTWIKKSKKIKTGLSFFKGDRGRGKTSILKYLAEKTDRIILYIPTNCLDHTINNPDFKNFLKNSKYLIVIDDCEVVCNYPNLVLINNIHQLVDGILSDSIGVQILMIYNSEIPLTVMTVNNIIDIIEFKKISAAQASELSKREFTKDVNLIDVLKKNKKENNKISL